MVSRFNLLFLILIITPPILAQDEIDFGRYHALVIGNKNYQHLTDLQTPIADATEVARLLKEKYNFKTTLLKDATRAEIITAMNQLRRKLTRKDNLLIYYAGHGYLDEETDTGYWQPVDAQKNNDVNWIPTTAINRSLTAMNAKHIMVVSDSCYAGSLLTRDSGSQLPTGMEQQIWLQRMAKKASRTALTSGGLEPVLDYGGGNYSVFAKAFLDVLKENEEILDGFRLFNGLKHSVVLKAKQTPRYADIRSMKHEGGDFLLIPKHIQKTGLHQKQGQGLALDLLRGNLAISPIEEEYQAKKNVRIRQLPDVSSPQTGSLKRGENVYVAGKVSDQPWYLVEYSGKQGYVYSSLLGPLALISSTVNKKTLTKPIIDIEMMKILSDCFQMGSNYGRKDEKPVHRVCLKQDYYLGKYEVTQGQWQAIMGNNPSKFKKGANYPVEMVSWNDIQDFISKLNAKTGDTYRLPTEAEWEYACRSGGKEQTYCGGNSLSVAWYAYNSGQTTHRVGQKQANGFGLHDMSGNVWEWVQDWHGKDYYQTSPTNDPAGPSGGSIRSLRGGSWGNDANSSRSAKRAGNTPSSSYKTLGFRLARSL